MAVGLYWPILPFPFGRSFTPITDPIIDTPVFDIGHTKITANTYNKTTTRPSGPTKAGRRPV